MYKREFKNRVSNIVYKAMDEFCAQTFTKPKIFDRFGTLLESDQRKLINMIVNAVILEFSPGSADDELTKRLEQFIGNHKFIPSDVTKTIIKTKFTSKVLVTSKIKRFGQIKELASKLDVKGLNSDYVYNMTHRTTAFLELLESEWPRLISACDRLNRRQSRTSEFLIPKHRQTQFGNRGNVGIDYRGFFVYAEHYSSTKSKVIRIAIKKQSCNKVGLTEAETKIFNEIKNDLAKMFNLMDSVEKVEIDTSCLVVLLVGPNEPEPVVNTPVPVPAITTSPVHALRLKIESHQVAAKTNDEEIVKLEKRLEELKKHREWISSDISILTKAVEIMSME